MKVVGTRVRGGALTRRLFASGLQQAWQFFGDAGGQWRRSGRRHRLRNHTAFGRWRRNRGGAGGMDGVVCGVRCAVCGVRCAVCGVRCAVCGQCGLV